MDNNILHKQGATINGISIDSKTFIIRLMPVLSQLAMELVLTGKITMKGKDAVPAKLLVEFLKSLIEEIENG